MEEYSRNWAGSRAYAIAGVEMALLDLKGKALGVPVAELLGGFCRERVPVIGYLFIDEPEANARKAAAFVDAGHTELKLKVGRDLEQDHDTIAAIRDRVGPRREDPDRREHELERPGGDQVDPRARAGSTSSSSSSRCPTSTSQGLAQVRRAVATPIAADESCTTCARALELIKADACDVFVVYPSEAGGLTRARQIGALAAAAGKWCAIGSWAELGVATPATPTSRRRRPTSRSRATRTIRCRSSTSSTSRSRSTDGLVGSRAPGLGVTLDPEAVATLSALELRESPFYDDIQGEAPSVGQIL